MNSKTAFFIESFNGAILSAWLALAVGCGQSPSFVARTDSSPSSSDATAANAAGETVEKDLSTGTDQIPGDDLSQNADGGLDAGDEPVTTPTPVGDNVDEGRFTAEIKTNDGQTVAIDSFLLAETLPIHSALQNSMTPLKNVNDEQTIGAPRSLTRSVLPQTLQTKTFPKNAPLRNEQPHVISYVNKPIDLFVTVDDSESFTQESIERTRTAIKKLVADVYGADWRLFLGGLEGVSGNFDKVMISKGSQTLAQANAAVDTALNTIFAEGSNGDERVIRSLNRLAYDYRSNDRDNAVHAYLIITDAPNCKDRNNGESSACTRSEGQNDHHNYLLNYNSNVAVAVRKNMELVGAYYRQTNNLAVCGNADEVEVPAAGETLKLNSQYAALSFASERLLDSSIAAGAAASWVGNLCSASESLGWLTTFTNAIKSAAAHRFVLTQAPDAFTAPDLNYNLALHQPLNTILSSSHMAVRDTYVIVVDEALSGTVTAVYHKQNDYRKTNYDNLLSPLPESGTVQVSWSGGPAFDCEAATSFTGLSAAVMCRHNSDDLYLRDTDFLPNLVPGDASVTINVTYYNHVEPVTVLDVTSADVIYGDSVAFTHVPAGFNAAGATMSALNDGKTVRFVFSNALPDGDYTISYSDVGLTRNTVTLPTAVANTPNNVLCYLPDVGVTAAIDAGGSLVVTPPSALYPCTFTAANKTVKYEGRVPQDNDGKRTIAIAYKGFVSPVSVFALEYPPFANKVSVTIDHGATGKEELASSQYQVADNQVVLAEALLPGEAILFDYLFLPPLKDCYLLSGQAFTGHDYFVWYGSPGDEERFAEDRFTIEKKAKGQTICLKAGIVDYGMRLVVGYVSAEKPRPDVK